MDIVNELKQLPLQVFAEILRKEKMIFGLKRMADLSINYTP